MRALVPFAAVAGVVLGGIRLWLQVYRPTPSGFRGRVVRWTLNAILIVFALALLVVLVVVVVGVLAEVASNVT